MSSGLVKYIACACARVLSAATTRLWAVTGQSQPSPTVRNGSQTILRHDAQSQDTRAVGREHTAGGTSRLGAVSAAAASCSVSWNQPPAAPARPFVPGFPRQPSGSGHTNCALRAPPSRVTCVCGCGDTPRAPWETDRTAQHRRVPGAVPVVVHPCGRGCQTLTRQTQNLGRDVTTVKRLKITS